MPRLLPIDWIKRAAIYYLLQLYEREDGFVQEWEKVKQSFAPLIEQMGKVSTLIEAEDLLTKSPPSNLIAWISDLQKLRNYLRNLLGTTDLYELRESCANLRDELTPYILILNTLAYNWNLRASWAGDELLRRDVQRIQEDVLNAAGAVALFELTDQQIQSLLGRSEGQLPSGTQPFNILLLYLAGGRRGFIGKLNERLIDFEKRLKASGAKEPPSALRSHAEWWFDHYVHNMSFSDIANGTIGPKNEAGRYPENVRKAILGFSELINIEPEERS